MDATAERRFIVQDLDDTHLVVHAESVDSALKALEEHVRRIDRRFDLLANELPLLPALTRLAPPCSSLRRIHTAPTR